MLLLRILGKFLKLPNLQNINWPYPNRLGLTWNLKLKKSLTKKPKKNIIIRKEHSAFIVAYYSVLHRMTLIGHAYFSQFTEWQNLGLKTLKHAIYAPNIFLKLPENQIATNFFYLTSSNFVTISHMNYWDQVIEIVEWYTLQK